MSLSLEMMKGTPEILFALRTTDRVLQLVHYVDGSFGIVSNDRTIGVWEPDEEIECLKTLAVMSGMLRA